ncbi:hypothetical protein VP1G_00379 [Cytospora mali]|uniref:Alpha/beta hydrolase fold-3 domain-containing protein n=1 Tax=Cytospora mali TaxID=578113 RepID=A0A194UN84_CYTMA|nr:hypothetical protein VP1G_00379 [Valsa mali var. pyri (nom. inval.)]
MNRMNTATVGLAVTPTVLSTLVSHYLNRKPLHQRPTAHLSYDEGLHLIRSFLQYASHHTVEDVQAFSAQWVPHPQWIKVDEVKVPEDQLDHAARLLEAQLGPEGIRKIGGLKWWQWRKPNASALRAEWIEMRSDYHERKKNNDSGKRVMLYVHGGAYFFGSVDMHRYQMQRHARKLKARVFAPDYRLSPQFPFPCGLQDCLAAYLYLLTVQEPNTIILAGDSAGGGMVLSMLVTLRDQGIPLPAGAVLISPWCDLTHSFPSVAGEAPFDYIPQSGFHQKPSPAWPPPGDDELRELKRMALLEKQKKQSSSKGKEPASEETSPTEDDIANSSATHLTVEIDGKTIVIEEQIQMYTTNELLSHPLVSPVMQPTLGGLPPLLIMVGGGEILRDEQIYIAHKCANPHKYLPPESTLDDKARVQIQNYKPTDVQLQVWDDLCHVAPTLSFTRPAKYMYRSVSQFSAWALARAQKTEIEILDDDDISVISTTTSDSDREEMTKRDEEATMQESKGQIGKAGEALPPFQNHMIRQRVTRHGVIFPLAPSSQLPGCTMAPELVGVVKEGPVRKWLAQKNEWDRRFASAKKKTQKKFLQDLIIGYEGFGEGELPPPSALAGRRLKGGDEVLGTKKRVKSMGMAMWSGWGSKHDKVTMQREEKADKEGDKSVEVSAATGEEGQGARSYGDIERQPTAAPVSPPGKARSRSRRVSVRDQRQTEVGDDVDENTTVAELLAKRKEKEAESQPPQHLAPTHTPEVGIGTTGKRPYVDGIAVPFSIKKEAETASMMTLTSNISQGPGSPGLMPPRTMSPSLGMGRDSGEMSGRISDVNGDHDEHAGKDAVPAFVGGATPDFETPAMERPGLETFSTAAENLPTSKGQYNATGVD